jgi:hypothetical protein
MVIRTEYMSQRYSMGSSDLLPAGFEIRFGSLNFQATGNDYLMRITNHDELYPWRSTGPDPIPATPATDAPAPTQADAAGASALDADGVLASACARREWSDAGLRAPRREATCQPASPRGLTGSIR